jgi:hypothetical protein
MPIAKRFDAGRPPERGGQFSGKTSFACSIERAGRAADAPTAFHLDQAPRWIANAGDGLS